MADPDIIGADRTTMTVSMGVLFGMLTSLMKEYQDVVACFRSCDSWVLKSEKVLTYVAFMLGVTKPGQVVYSLLRKLLNRASVRLFDITFDDHPNFEKSIEFILSYLGQRKLAEIWDLVKENSLCMRMNNCELVYFAELNNQKLYWCDVDPGEDDWYSGRKLSTCEQLFNDSPLILLAVFVVGLFSVAWCEGDPRLPGYGTAGEPQSSRPISNVPPENVGTNPQNTSAPQGPTPNPGTHGPPPNTGAPKTTSASQGPTQNPGTQGPPQNTDAPSPQSPTSNPGPQGPPPNTDAPPITDPPGPPGPPISQPKPKPSTSTTSPGNTQPIEATCPTCKNQFQAPIPHPMPMYCCKSCVPVKGNNSTYKDNEKAINEEVSKQVDKFMKDVRRLLCSKCKKKTEGTEPDTKIARLDVCKDCGHEHKHK